MHRQPFDWLERSPIEVVIAGIHDETCNETEAWVSGPVSPVSQGLYDGGAFPSGFITLRICCMRNEQERLSAVVPANNRFIHRAPQGTRET